MMGRGLASSRRASRRQQRRKTMPLITVSYSSPRTVAKADIASAVSALTAKTLHKDPKVTAIIVKSVDAIDWFAGGLSLADQKLASFWLDIHITQGTNT